MFSVYKPVAKGEKWLKPPAFQKEEKHIFSSPPFSSVLFVTVKISNEFKALLQKLRWMTYQFVPISALIFSENCN